MQCAYVEGVLYCVDLFIFSKRGFNEMRILHLQKSLNSMILYENEGITS